MEKKFVFPFLAIRYQEVDVKQLSRQRQRAYVREGKPMPADIQQPGGGGIDMHTGDGDETVFCVITGRESTFMEMHPYHGLTIVP